MPLIPDWAPNIHPLIIHFPIVLLLGAAILDVTAFFLRQKTGLHTGAMITYVLGAASAAVTYVTGRIAADSLMVSSEANMPLTDHADFAFAATIFFVLYAAVRILLWRRAFRHGTSRSTWAVVLLIGFLGYALIQQTAERGASLVYRYGVGVEPAYSRQMEDLRAEISITVNEGTGPVRSEGGGWNWSPSHPSAWKSSFRWVEGNAENTLSSIVARETGSMALALTLVENTMMFIYESEIQSVQIDLQISADDFEGSIGVVHHYRDEKNYLFTILSENRIQQGAIDDGTTRVMDDSAFILEGAEQFRIVADRTHFRAYAGARLVTHGHGTERPAGSVGFRIQGSGTVLLDAIRVRNLESQTTDH